MMMDMLYLVRENHNLEPAILHLVSSVMPLRRSFIRGARGLKKLVTILTSNIKIAYFISHPLVLHT